MRWTWQIGRVAGINLYLHYSFLILVGYFFFVDLSRGRDAWFFVWDLFLLAAAFSIVVLHELGHALMARRYGISTRHITLLPIGGVAQLSHLPDDPLEEMAVAFAGPAVNLFLAVLMGIPTLLLYPLHQLLVPAFVYENLLAVLAIMNLLLGLFNLIPAFPMDGGRILRALLATRMKSLPATRAAVYLGRVMAVLVGILGIFIDPILILVAVFVWIAGGREYEQVSQRERSAGIMVEDLMERRFVVLSPSDSVSAAAELIERFGQGVIPVVVEKRRLVGLISETDVQNLVLGGREGRLLEDLMRRQFPVVSPEDHLERAMTLFDSSGLSYLPVVKGERIEGILRLSDVDDFLDVG
ncbi:MAG TPA: site-2 protease family protein [Calditrichia bacterium]|nr:site-2 protease family protein [Calditrichia bacterium]